MPVNQRDARATQNGKTGVSASISLGWPTERWVALIVLVSLGILILIRVGFKGIGIQGSAGARVSM